MARKNDTKPSLVVIFVEGDTDEVLFKALIEYYRIVSKTELRPCKICNLRGVKVDTMPAKPFCYDSDELSRLSLVCVSEVLHFFVYYYICWIIRDLHNCLEFSYKGTNFLADLRI